MRNLLTNKRGLAFLSVFVSGYVSAASFSYADPNCESFQLTPNGSGAFTIVCVPPTAGGNAPSGCTLSATPSSVSSGQTVSLSASCTTNWVAGTTTFEFFKNNVSMGAASTSSTKTDAPTNASASSITVSYGVKACNNGDCSSTVYQSVTVAGTGGSGGGDDLCSGYTARQVAFPNGTSYDYASFGGQQVFVGSFVASKNAIVGAVPLGNGAPGEFTITISSHKCDFRARDTTGVNGPKYISVGGAPSRSYTVGTGSALVAGQTYYVNVIPKGENGAMTCASSNCNVRMTHSY